MLSEEEPHQSCCIDAVGCGSGEPFRQRHATRPRVASADDGVQDDGRIVRAVRVLRPRDVTGHRRFDGFRCTAIPPRPIRCPGRDVRKPVRRHPRETAAARGNAVSRPVERDRRHGSTVRTLAPREELSRSHQPNRGDAIGHRAGQNEGHTSTIGHPVGVYPCQLTTPRRSAAFIEGIET